MHSVRHMLTRTQEASAILGVLGGLVVWLALYSQLEPVSRWWSPRWRFLQAPGCTTPWRSSPTTRRRSCCCWRWSCSPWVSCAASSRRSARASMLAGRREGAGNVARRIARHRHAVLLLLRRAAVHRLRLRRRAARRHLLLSDLRADGERGGARPAVRPGRLARGAGLSRLRPRRRDRRRLGHRPPAAGALAGTLGSRSALGAGRDPSAGRPTVNAADPRGIGRGARHRRPRLALGDPRDRRRRADPRLCAGRSAGDDHGQRRHGGRCRLSC